MTYRPEIDGLRAVAVLPVIFFHAGFSTFSGGFVGVDVFFVISGYLITALILSERQAGNFSLLRFYERRARRLLPALYLVMLVCLPFAWKLMLPDDFENFGQSLVATTLFGNNILLWRTADYFGLNSQFKPLVHTWSLAVEEQFYIVYPLLLLLLLRMRNRGAALVLLALALLSLALSQWMATRAPVPAFYLFPTRAWELLLGAIVAFYAQRQPAGGGWPVLPPPARDALSLAGLAAIAIAVATFRNDMPHPGLYTLLPTLGTALVIAFCSTDTLTGKLLANRLLVGIGLISYSAYLWSNPLFAFARVGSVDEPTLGIYWVCIVATFILALVTWRFVEQPFRRGALFGKKTLLALAAGVGLLIASVGWVIHVNSGFVQLWPELDAQIKDSSRELNATFNRRPLQFQDAPFSQDARRKVLVLGDSFARDFINAGLENGYFSNSEISYSEVFLSCIGTADHLNEALRRRVARADVLIFGSPPPSLQCWRADFALLRYIGAKKIVVVGTKNFGWNLNAVMRLDPAERRQFRARVLQDIWAYNGIMARVLPEAHFVNQLALLADADRRVALFTEDGKLISQDRNHLTRHGARHVGKILFEHPLLRELR